MVETVEKVLTISIAAYNVEDYIAENLESIIGANRMDDIDVIIVNDGSKDGTFDIAQKYVNLFPNSISIINKENGGYGSTINNSIPAAKGKYYRLLDGDDWMEGEELATFVDLLKRIDCDLICTPYKTIINETQSEKIYSFSEKLRSNFVYQFEEVALLMKLQMHGMTFKTELLMSNNISITENCFYTDTEFAIYPLPYVKSIMFLNSVVYCYRLGLDEQSVSINGYKKHHRELRKVIRNTMNYYNQHKKTMGDNVNAIIVNRIVEMIKTQYSLYAIIGKEYYSDLIQFDKQLKKDEPKIFGLVGEAKSIYFLRKTSYLTMRFFSFYKKHRS